MLKFSNGFPDKATVEKVFDNLDFQRGVQAYLTALPAFSIEAFRRSYTKFGPVNQTVLISEQLLDLKSLFLTANATPPYTVLYLDTKDGPLVLEIPPAVLGPMDDAWFRWVSDVGFTGPDKGAGGKYLLLPPGYTGEVPEGYFVARSRTFGQLLFFRTFLKEGDPKPGVDTVIKKLRVYPLSRAANPPEMKFVNISGEAFNTIGPSDYSAFEYLNRVIQDEPNDAMDTDTLGVFAAIGIEKGKPFAPDARMKKILSTQRRWAMPRPAALPISVGSRTPISTRTVRGLRYSLGAVINSSRTACSTSTQNRCSSSMLPASPRR